MKRKCVNVLMVAMLAQAAPTWALDASSAQAYCDEVKKAGQAAQLRYIQTYQPRQDPGKTFDDAVSSCLDFITGFQVGIPSIWDGMLSAMAKQLMQRVCQTARGQFDKAVGDATQSVNGSVGLIPGVSVSTSSQAGAGVNVQGDNGSMMQNTANKAVDRVINIIK